MNLTTLIDIAVFAVLLAILVTVAVRRKAGFDTYWRMPLHLMGILVITVVIKALMYSSPLKYS